MCDSGGEMVQKGELKTQKPWSKGAGVFEEQLSIHRDFSKGDG